MMTFSGRERQQAPRRLGCPLSSFPPPLPVTRPWLCRDTAGPVLHHSCVLPHRQHPHRPRHGLVKLLLPTSCFLSFPLNYPQQEKWAKSGNRQKSMWGRLLPTASAHGAREAEQGPEGNPRDRRSGRASGDLGTLLHPVRMAKGQLFLLPVRRYTERPGHREADLRTCSPVRPGGTSHLGAVSEDRRPLLGMPSWGTRRSASSRPQTCPAAPASCRAVSAGREEVGAGAGASLSWARMGFERRGGHG